MDVNIVLESRYDRAPDGSVWTPGWFPYSFWTRYLEVFDGVHALARVRDVERVPDDWQRVDGAGVRVVPLPYFLGPGEYLKQAWRVRAALRRALVPQHATILRGPGIGPMVAYGVLARAARPYALEVVGDPYEVFSGASVQHPLRRLFRWLFSRALRQQTARARAVSYVTADALQRRYPPAEGVFTTHYSSVDLPGDAFVAEPRVPASGRGPRTIVTVGSLAQLYKAPDVLIDAVGLCLQGGLDLRLVLVGDGQHRPGLEASARELGLAGRVKFLGQLPSGGAVRAELDRADLFVLPSRTEGLPRALIEAMARALPCIASNVGGIPELLPAEDLVAPNDPGALARKVREVVTEPMRMERMSARNLEKAREYGDAVLRERRTALYRRIRDETESWLLLRKSAEIWR